MTRDEIIDLIVNERIRQKELNGSEWDITNSPNDWVAIISHYVGDSVRRNGIDPIKDQFRESLIKSAAVIMAALEHLDVMNDKFNK